MREISEKIVEGTIVPSASARAGLSESCRCAGGDGKLPADCSQGRPQDFRDVPRHGWRARFSMQAVARDLLLDGHSLAYRACSPCRRRSCRRHPPGDPGVFGFVSMLAKLLEDSRRPGWRWHSTGANRRFVMPCRDLQGGSANDTEPLLEQIELIRRLVETLGFRRRCRGIRGR